MGRGELAEAVCAWLWETTKVRYELDGHYIAKLERGMVRWPRAPYRSGLRHVLRATSDTDLGFRPPNRGATVPLHDGVTEPPPWIMSGAEPMDLPTFLTMSRYPAEPRRAVDVLGMLASADLSDSPVVAQADWTPETAPNVITSYLFADPVPESQPGPITEVASRIRVTIRYLTDLDFQFGGGHSRKMLLHYWTTEIAPALRTGDTERRRRDILAAAADAAEVLGWSAYDAGRHGAAQRYFVQGLRLAREVNDHMMGGQILSNLSHQANYLGKFSDAVQFARAAQAATSGKATATVTAMLLAMEARALASVGDAQASAKVLHRADQAMERSSPTEDPEWISYFDALELAGEAAHCFRDLGQAKQTRRFVAEAIDPVRTPPRTRALINMVDAAGALAAGDVDEAVSVARAAVGVAGSLRSSRYQRYVSDFRRVITEKHASHAAVREFAEQHRVGEPQSAI